MRSQFSSSDSELDVTPRAFFLTCLACCLFLGVMSNFLLFNIGGHCVGWDGMGSLEILSSPGQMGYAVFFAYSYT
jgi:hypothetical protein